MRKLISLLVLCFTLTIAAFGQNQSQIARASGVFYANAFNTWKATLYAGFTGIGAQAGVVYGGGAVPLKDGTIIYPFNVNAPLIWDAGQAGAENLATTGVVGCTSYSTVEPPPCAVAATFANAHGRGATIKSGTAGLQEALNFAFQKGGGIVVVDQAWVNDGGTEAILGLAAGYANVTIEDFRGPVPQWKSLAPTTLAGLATPAVRSAAVGNTEVRSATLAEVPVGTFANAAQFACVTYVDALGGESQCSPTYNWATGSAVLGVYFASPAASPGAVGWRAYVGLSYALAYQLPLTAANCTLSTLEFAYPACAIGSRALFVGPSVATALHPEYVVNTLNPQPNGHIQFAYVPMNKMPLGPIQTHYGPFPATVGSTAGQPMVLGTVRLPTGYLNFIGKSLRVSGKVTLATANAATTGQILVQLGPTFTAGTPTNVCTITDTTTLSAAAYNYQFFCTITTNAVGGAGTVMSEGSYIRQLAAGTTLGIVAVDSPVAAIAAIDVQGQNVLYVTFIGATNTAGATQLLSLHLEPLN